MNSEKTQLWSCAADQVQWNTHIAIRIPKIGIRDAYR